ncbi:MAG: response regulator [Paracoccaceae bacterium]|nr:response regulator [Paracoccaceae bacterium]
MAETAAGVFSRSRWLIAVAIACIATAVWVEESRSKLVLTSAGVVFSMIAVIAASIVAFAQFSARRLRRQVLAIVEHDAAPTFCTDFEGEILFQNRAAELRFGKQGRQSLPRAMAGLFANPAAVMFRLQSRAGRSGASREDVVTRRGHARLSVHRIGRRQFLWRLEEMMERGDAAGSVSNMHLPMMIASKSGTVVFMNDALRMIVKGRPKTLDRVFLNLPIRSGEEAMISTPDGPIRTMVAEIAGSGDRREIYLLPVSDGDGQDLNDQDALFENLPVALVRISSTGLVEAANQLGRDYLGLSAEEQPAFGSIVGGLGRPVGDWITDTLAGRADGRPEVLRASRRKEDRFFQISLRRVSTRGTPQVFAVLNDATDLKTMEAQVVQSQKMLAIGQLAGGIAHDFNNLLTAITGHCDLLLLRRDENDPDYADLIQVQQNTNRAASLVRQLLAFSRKQILLPEVIDLPDILSDLSHLLNRLVGERVLVEQAWNEELDYIRADRRQFEQVLMNLVVNARDAMPDGGRIWIEAENCTLPEALHRDQAVVPAGKYVIVQVRDEGMGTPAERMPKIFEPVFTTKGPGEGTGLGLSTAYGIVKQTGGYIFVDSVVGAGTTFSLYFPALDYGPEVPKDGSLAGASRRVAAGSGHFCEPGGVVLLVEDEAPVRAFAARALRLHGYEVIEADSGDEALRKLADPLLRIDVIVSDVIMPGVDGPTWVREALKTRDAVRVVFVSGYAEDAFSEVYEGIPNSAFLPKPFSLAELTSMVRGQIH